MDRQNEQLAQENDRLRGHIREAQAEQQRTRDTSEKLGREMKEQAGAIERLEVDIDDLTQEINSKE